MRIIVTGLIAQYPLGGVTWDYFQYVLGLVRLGHDVFYIEDTGQWPYQPVEGGLTKDPSYNVDYIASLMKRFDLGESWAYCYPWQTEWFGMSEERRREVIATADLMLNVSGVMAQPERYRGTGRMVYIDSDPVFTQVKLARGQSDFRQLIESHDVQFSFGERLGDAVPATEFEWLPTRQPIVLDEWQPVADYRAAFTTVMSWASFNPIEFEGRKFGQKDLEFPAYLDLPSLVAPTTLEVAASTGKKIRVPVDQLRHKGWQLADPNVVSRNIDAYRDYVRSSMGEWSVAKNGYVVGQPGWFSCRSACYLAAGRPVVVQETGFSGIFPVGDGVVPFTNLEQAAAGIQDVVANYPRHARAARAIAEEYLDSGIVLTSLIERAMA